MCESVIFDKVIYFLEFKITATVQKCLVLSLMVMTNKLLALDV
jgi:hypothetical protein